MLLEQNIIKMLVSRLLTKFLIPDFDSSAGIPSGQPKRESREGLEFGDQLFWVGSSVSNTMFSV